MAEYQAPMAEKLRKSVGNVTYYIMHGKTFARAKVAHVKNAKTPKQLRHRATFTMLVQLARVLIETTRTGFPEKAKGRSSSNEFVRANKNIWKWMKTTRPRLTSRSYRYRAVNCPVSSKSR